MKNNWFAQAKYSDNQGINFIFSGCLSPMLNERGFTRNFVMTASSELDGRHRAGYSRLYAITSWCSSSVSPPQYLEADFRKVITVTGIATQGDTEVDKWVISYVISYGYDKRTWFNYAGGQVRLHMIRFFILLTDRELTYTYTSKFLILPGSELKSFTAEY